MNSLLPTSSRFLAFSLTLALTAACARTTESENPAYTPTQSARRAVEQEPAEPAQDTVGASQTAPDAKLSAVSEEPTAAIPARPRPTPTNYQTALRTATTGLEKNPRNLDLLLTRADANSHLGNYENALQDYSSALRLDSDNPLTYYQRGLTRLQLKEYSLAVIDFSKALKYKTDFKEALVSRGKAKMRMANYKSAIGDFDQAIALDPSYAEAYQNRGISYSSLSRPTEAHADLEKAAELAPNASR